MVLTLSQYYKLYTPRIRTTMSQITTRAVVQRLRMGCDASPTIVGAHPYNDSPLVRPVPSPFLVFGGDSARHLRIYLGSWPVALLRNQVTWLNFGSACCSPS